MRAKPALLAFAAVLATSPACAAELAGAFGQGRVHVAAAVGSGSAFDQSYLILGVGASYYLLDGLNVGLFVESWTGASPHLTTVTPSVQYVLYQVPTVKPYLGVFYRRTSIEDRADINSDGVRAGVYIQAARNAYIGFGGVYESYLDCNNARTVFKSCSTTYPEVSLTFAF